MRAIRIINLAAIVSAGVIARGQVNNPATPSSTPAPAANLPFTISKETTGITSPLRADGMPDYLAAVNEKHGKGVTLENNGFVVWLKVYGTELVGTNPKNKAQILNMCGAKETPKGVEVWSFDDEMKARGFVDNAIRSKDALGEAGFEEWTAAEHPAVADFLHAKSGLLALTVEASLRPRWWIPYVADDSQTLYSANHVFGMLRSVTESLDARATLRAKSGDIDGFLADVLAVKRLARHSASGATLIERMLGIAIDTRATRTLGAVVGTGKLSLAQCNAVNAALKQLPPMLSARDAIDGYERWAQLNIVELLALNQNSFYLDIFAGISDTDKTSPAPKMADSLDRNEVDWDSILKMVNKQADALVEASKTTDFAEMMSRLEAFDQNIEALSPVQIDANRKDFRKRPDETRAAYTQFIGQRLLTLLTRGHGRTMEIARRGSMREEMANLVLDAATMKARTGNWPATLREVVPAGVKELPLDGYAKGGKETLKYVVKGNGIMIYSVGPDGRDDGGQEDWATKTDDIGVGVK